MELGDLAERFGVEVVFLADGDDNWVVGVGGCGGVGEHKPE